MLPAPDKITPPELHERIEHVCNIKQWCVCERERECVCM
jgi:hypothetical protein